MLHAKLIMTLLQFTPCPLIMSSYIHYRSKIILSNFFIVWSIRQRHASLGLLKCRGKRKLGDDDEPSSTAVDDPSDAEDDSFEGLVQNLIDSAINDEAADEAEEATAPSSAPAVPNQQCTRRLARTQIPLASLFNFTWLDNRLDFYWKGAIRNLDADAAACELAFSQQEGFQVPGMPDTLPCMIRHHFGLLDIIYLSCRIFITYLYSIHLYSTLLT